MSQIDKVLGRFMSRTPAVRLQSVVLNVYRVQSLGLKVRPQDSNMVSAWEFTFGMEYGAQKSIYGYSAKHALLRASKWLRKAKNDELVALGLKRPCKSNNFRRNLKKKKTCTP